MKKVFDYLFIILVLCILIIPVLNINTEHFAVSSIDNRALVFEPDFSSDNYQDQVESYLNDRIGYRNMMIKVYDQINDIVADELTHPTYTYGQNGYVFFNMHLNVEYSEYHIVFAEFVKNMQDYCESRGSKFYFVFDPEKINIYRDYLPQGVNYNDAWVDQFLDYLDQLGVTYINNSSYLSEIAKSEQVFNKQFDAGHWNELGCFYATNHVLSRIHEDFPLVRELSKDDFDISTSVARYLPVSEFEVNETIPKFQIKKKFTNETSAYSQGLEINQSYSYFHYFVNDDQEQLPKLLLFQGSYYNSRNQFFVSQTSECIGVHDYQNVCNLDYYYNAFQPDIVIFEVAEYTFQDKYFSKYSMQNINWNPALVDARATDSYESDMDTFLENASEGESKSLHLLKYDKLTKCYVYPDDVFSSKYVYLLSENHVYDMKLDSDGLYSSTVSDDIDMNNTKLLLVGYDDKISIHECSCLVSSFQKEQPTLSNNVRYVQDLSQYVKLTNMANKPGYVISTDFEGNYFDAVDIQLINISDGRFMENILNTTSSGKKVIRYRMKYPTGWYKIRLKANSNKHDEYMEYRIFLCQGEYYVISFEVIDKQSDQIVTTPLTIYGTGSKNDCNDVLSESMSLSAETSVIGHNSYEMVTTVQDNHFNSVILQAVNLETNELTPHLLCACSSGQYHGYYSHNTSSGLYRIWLRGNSNIKDEYIECYVDLEEFALYEYSFEIVEISEHKICIKDYEFKKIAE